jgi:hypothetical protein
VLEIVVVCSTKISAHGSVVVGNDNSATPCGLLGVNAVFNSQTCCLDCIVQNGSVFVVTDTTEVYDAVRRQEVLGAPSSVLRSASSDELCRVVV